MKNIKSYEKYNEELLGFFKKKGEITKEEVEKSKYFMSTLKAHPEYTKAIRFALSNMNGQNIPSKKRQTVIDEIALWIARIQRNYKYITDAVLANEYNAFLTPEALGL